MVTRDNAWPAGTPCWVDLGADSVDKAAAFYSALLGWQVQPGPPEAGGYSICFKDGKSVAGIGPKQDPNHPTVWTTYLATDNLDETASKVTAAGGQVLVEPMNVMAAGRMAIAADVDGAVFGIWQSGEHTGMELANEPGAVTWNENMSRNFDGNKNFYEQVFGFEYEDMSSDEFTYAVFSVGGNVAGGLGLLAAETPAEVPANWTTYFAVSGADDSVAKVRDLGGTVHAPAVDTPHGRMAIVADDQGAIFALIDTSTATE